MNKTLFRDYKVSYNTRRLRTDQSSKESIAQGMATCTGLSIMLVEACRTVGRYLTCEPPPSRSVLVIARYGDDGSVRAATVAADTVVRIDVKRPAPEETRAELSRVFADRFGTDDAKRATARKLLCELPWDESMREIAWAAYKASPAHESLRNEYKAKMVATKDRKSPYLWRHIGTKPPDGWALVIAMHGGGGMAKEINDQQWRSMFERYYKPHPEAGGYVYMALRAPTTSGMAFMTTPSARWSNG